MRNLMLTLALCSACGMPEDDAPHARRDAVTRRDDDDGIIIMNGLAPDDLGENLLLNDEVRRDKLIHSPLTTSSFASGQLADAIRFDPRAARVLKYLVRCALEPTGSVTAGGSTYTGSAGLCPTWALDGIASDVTCQRHVTACLLGLSNVVGAHVPVSMRGDGPGLAPAPSMHPRSFLANGNTVTSLGACTSSTYGVSSNCGWDPVDSTAAASAGIDTVFSCTPRSNVKVGGGSSCSGTLLGTMSPGSDKVLRVCAGTSACDHAEALAENEGACGSIRPYISFTCPDEGHYVVMQRDYAVYFPAGTPGTMTVGQTGSLGPASEVSLFPLREAAFYGTVFEGALGRKVSVDLSTGKLTTTVVSYKAPVFERLYSCVDADWDAADAYRTRRLCGLGGQCLSDDQGVCQAGVCAGVVDDAPAGSGAFTACKGADGLTYDDGLTTFLRASCDLLSSNPQDLACKR